jgi:hypothetical protein
MAMAMATGGEGRSPRHLFDSTTLEGRSASSWSCSQSGKHRSRKRGACAAVAVSQQAGETNATACYSRLAIARAVYFIPPLLFARYFCLRLSASAFFAVNWQFHGEGSLVRVW